MESDIQINRLPLEILGTVMSFLKWPHRQNAMLVCKRWYEVLRQPVFQRGMFINLNSLNRLTEIPSSLVQREIQNMRIYLGEGKSPNFSKLAGLLPHMKFVHLDNVFSVADINLCVQHFPRLEAIKIESDAINSMTWMLGQNKELRRCFSAVMAKLREATVVIPCWYGEDDLIMLLDSLSGVSEVSLEWQVPIDDEIENRDSPMTGFHLVDLLGRSQLVERLYRLDLPCFYLSPESFSLLVEMHDLNLHSLEFVSYDGARHLEILAKSGQNLQSLDVTFEGSESYNVKYAAISALQVAKPSLKSINISGVLYHEDELLSTIYEEWPKASTVHIPWCTDEDLSLLPDDVSLSGSTLVEFRQEAGKNTLFIKSLLVIFGEEALSALAQNSPCLEELRIQTSIDCFDAISLPLLLDSLPDMTKLSVSFTRLSHGDMRIPAISNGVTNSLLNLQSLYLGYCKFLTDADIVTLRFPNLKHLWLSNSLKITDSGLCSTVASNPGLRLLGLGGCTHVTDRSVEAIGTHLRYLQCLLLFQCPKVTPDAARMLEDGCQMLEFIDVHGCREDLISAMKRMKCSMRYLSDILYSIGCSGILMMTSKWSFAIRDDWMAHDLPFPDHMTSDT